MRSSLRPPNLGLKVPFLEMHFIELMIRNVPTKAATAAIRRANLAVFVLLALNKLTSSDRSGSLATPPRLPFPIRLKPWMTVITLITSRRAFPDLLIAPEELVLLYFINRVITVMLQLLLRHSIRLIIFNQNCLSVCVTFLFR
jgi:hypothetical protein